VLLVASTNGDADAERDLALDLVHRQIDGLLIQSNAGTLLDQAAGITSVPIVYLDRAPASERYDRVLLDNRGGVERALHRLLADGHRRIGYVGGSPETTTGAARLGTYLRFLAERGVAPDPLLISTYNTTTDGARDATIAQLGSARPPTAIFSDNQRLLLGAIQARLATGAQVALAGFDDLELTDLLPFDVDLVSYAAADVGRYGARQLFRRIDGDTRLPMTRQVDTRLVRRGRVSID